MSDVSVVITPPATISATVGAAGDPIAVSVADAAPITVTVSNLPGEKGDKGDPGENATVTYSAVITALGGGGALTTRYDATQPQVDCLWVAPSGQVVLITGS
jgi:hypothetical protein